MTDNKPEEWEKEFDNEFTHEGILGERRFSLIRVTHYEKNSPLVLDDQVIADLKDFIRTHFLTKSQVKSVIEEMIVNSDYLDGDDYFKGKEAALSDLATRLGL